MLITLSTTQCNSKTENHIIEDYRNARHYKPRLVFFDPFFTAVYNQERLILQTIYVLNKEILLKSAVYNQERFQIKSGL